jgi:hypothetical protein
VAALARRAADGPDRMLVVDSHRDLDRPNTLLAADGPLMALDWDAAGPIGQVHEAAGFALDWSDADPPVFGRLIRAYRERTGLTIPAEPWIFGGWMAGLGGWLDHNADHRPDTPVGAAEVAKALAAMRKLAAGTDAFLAEI